MRFIGVPTVQEMHNLSEEQRGKVQQDPLGFYAHVLAVLNRFSGCNVVPRVVCGVLTREYLNFECREGHHLDNEEMGIVAEQFKKQGFYCELRNSVEFQNSDSSSLLVCWDPKVIIADDASRLLDPDAYQSYMEILRYVRAEQTLPDVAKESKDEILIDACYTREWVSVPIISNLMYGPALRAASVLWDQGYYTGFRIDTRRAETWTLFVCWDFEITRDMGEKAPNLVFTGEVPRTWR